MTTNLLKAIEEMKEELMNGWSEHERTHFKDYLNEEIKPYYPNLYALLSGGFEAELLEEQQKQLALGLKHPSIRIEEILGKK